MLLLTYGVETQSKMHREGADALFLMDEAEAAEADSKISRMHGNNGTMVCDVRLFCWDVLNIRQLSRSSVLTASVSAAKLPNRQINFERLCWRPAARGFLHRPCGSVLAVVSGACMVCAGWQMPVVVRHAHPTEVPTVHLPVCSIISRYSSV